MTPTANTYPHTHVHWRVEHDASDILWAYCDREGESANSLSEAVLLELGDIIGYAEQNPSLAGLVILSDKKSGFIVGADIREFDHFESADEVIDRIREGHALLQRLENLPCHTVAAIHGFCLGGGLELALACDYIIAMNTDNTRVGLPEVKLGIFPGLGGTVRLTERLGGMKAMQLMLTGRVLRIGAAKGMGVVDELVQESGSLFWAARRAVLKRRKKRPASRKDQLTNQTLARKALARVMRKQTAAKANPDHYPAPFALIDLWEKHRDNRREMFRQEAIGVGKLMVGPTARNLRRIFFLTERMKGLGKVTDTPVRRVHVVGAGVMGGDIAAWCVVQGMEVTLQDRELKYIEPAIGRAKALFKKRLKSKPAVSAATARLIPDVDGKGVARADVIIEAIFEDRDAKRALFESIEPRMQPHAVLATNTSAIPLEELSSVLNNPARLIGLHFFNPVAKMQLVEVVHAPDTEQEWIDKGNAFCTQIGRLPLPTRSSPGFLVNRVLAPYLMEAMKIHLQGVDRETIDAAAVDFGMPMGPIELADVVGLDVCIKVAETLSDGDVEQERQLLQGMIDRKHLGKKTSQGFYAWEKGKAVKKSVPHNNAYNDVIGKRLLKPFLDECVACEREKVVEDADLLDAGIIFGTGFAPFYGGPMNYLEHHRPGRPSARASSKGGSAISV